MKGNNNKSKHICTKYQVYSNREKAFFMLLGQFGSYFIINALDRILMASHKVYLNVDWKSSQNVHAVSDFATFRKLFASCFIVTSPHCKCLPLLSTYPIFYF